MNGRPQLIRCAKGTPTRGVRVAFLPAQPIFPIPKGFFGDGLYPNFDPGMA
jgi:hypothetical protein